MLNKREAILRHATHYVRVAQEHRTNLRQLTLELANIVQAGDFCIQLTDWDLLASLTNAINDYLVRKGRWLDYINLNTPLVTHDLTEQHDARIERVLQLIELEENRGNYPQALYWNKFLVELHQSEKNQDLGAVIDALKRMAKLSQRHGKDNDAADHLMHGLSFARRFEDTKNEVDLLFELASFYKRQGDFENSRVTCESAITLARAIGYSVAELDTLTLTASLYVNDEPDRAFSLYQEAIVLAKTLEDVQRHSTVQLELDKLVERIAIEQAKKKRKVFISYSHRDREFVERLANDLKKRGFSVWWDEWEIRVGESIIQRISEGIDYSAYLIAVLSPHSVESDFVRREIGSALTIQLSPEKKIVILPLLVSDCEIPTLLREIKWADFRNDYGKALKSLLERLQDTVTQV
jgi:predicted nucleotide-binding protein